LEAFDLAAGGGVSGAGVLLVDAEAAQFGLEAVAAAAAAGEAGGEDHAVVGQGGRRGPVTLDGLVERVDDRRSGDGLVGGDEDGVAGVIVHEAEDLDVSAIGEGVVGEVGLPAFVGQLGGEPDVGGLGPLGRLRDHQASASQVAGHRRGRDPYPVAVLQVPHDGVRSRVQALALEIFAELDDQLDRGRRQRPR